MAVENYKSAFRDHAAPESADVSEAFINNMNEAMWALRDGKLGLGEIFGWVSDEAGGIIKAGKGIDKVDDELKALGFAKVSVLIDKDLDMGLNFPPELAKVERKVNAVRKAVKANIECYLVLAEKDDMSEAEAVFGGDQPGPTCPPSDQGPRR